MLTLNIISRSKFCVSLLVYSESEFIRNNPLLRKIVKSQTQTPNKDGYVMIRRVIDSDNSCLFNSIGFLMYGLKTKAKFLRQVVHDEISSKPEEYQYHFDKTIQEYLDWILLPTSWGGGTEIFILSKYFQVEICIINIETLNDVVYGENSGYTKRIYLLYSGIHYDAITRNLFDEMPEADDQRQFDIDDKYAYEGSLWVASELRKAKQYTNLKECALICQVCFKGMASSKDALAHATATTHQNFLESSDYAAPV